MSELLHSLVGLPRSGKTTFLAALWHVVDAGEVDTQLTLNKLVGSNAYLNRITEAWRRCEEVPRTSLADEAQVTIHGRVVGRNQAITIEVPDLSGESFREQFVRRSCTSQYRESFDHSGGVLLFINANRPTDGLTLADLSTLGAEPEDAAVAEPEDAAVAEPEVDWNPEMAPEQVQLVDLLQFIQRRPFRHARRKLGLVISAWDAVMPPVPTPAEWLAREMPLLNQYLQNNASDFNVRVYGVSAQGGDVTGAKRAELLTKVPSLRIQCVGPETSEHDITAPLVWLSAPES